MNFLSNFNGTELLNEREFEVNFGFFGFYYSVSILEANLIFFHEVMDRNCRCTRKSVIGMNEEIESS